jgi:hypothetical protein
MQWSRWRRAGLAEFAVPVAEISEVGLQDEAVEDSEFQSHNLRSVPESTNKILIWLAGLPFQKQGKFSSIGLGQSMISGHEHRVSVTLYQGEDRMPPAKKRPGSSSTFLRESILLSTRSVRPHPSNKRAH